MAHAECIICSISTCKVKTYHRECVGMPAHSKINSPWVCLTCKATLPRDSNANTPSKDTDEDMEEPSSGPGTGPDSLISELRLVREEIGSLRTEITHFRKEMKDVRADIAACNSNMLKLSEHVDMLDKQVHDLEARIDRNTNSVTSITQRLNNMDSRLEEAEAQKEHHTDVSQVLELQATIEQLKSELNDKEQNSLMNDLEISGLPEQQHENTVHMVKLIAAKMGVTIDDRDVVEAWRAGPRRLSAAAPAAPAPPLRARPLVVRCARRSVRDALLAAARVRRSLKTRDLGLTGDVSIYINERLTRTNRCPFGKAKEIAKRLQWKYVWSYNGRILVRKAVGLNAHQISCEDDLNGVFSIDSTNRNSK
jgi:prefoldin subunit 5